MLNKTRTAGLIIATAAGAVLMGTPAYANGWDNNTQGVPAQLCNSDVAAAIGAVVPVGSPETVVGPCVNGAVQD